MYLPDEREGACGTVYWTFDPHSGKKISNIWTCKKFRECMNCRVTRFEEEKVALENSMKDRNLYYTKMDDVEFRRFARKVKADHYRRYPLPSGMVMIVSDIQKDSFLWLNVDEGNVEKVARLCIIPEGTRTSGNLLKEECEESGDGPKEVVRIPVYYTDEDLDDKTCELARRQAIKVFWQDRPNTAQYMIDTYHSCLDIVLSARGLPRPKHDEDMWILRTVNLEKVDWGGYNPLNHGNAHVFDDAQLTHEYQDLFGIRLGV